jgi:predicted metal-dependent RNase
MSHLLCFLSNFVECIKESNLHNGFGWFCGVEAIGGYSAHADQRGLLSFVAEAQKGNLLKRVFVVQGEESSAQALGQKIEASLHVAVTVPVLNEVAAV